MSTFEKASASARVTWFKSKEELDWQRHTYYESTECFSTWFPKVYVGVQVNWHPQSLMETKFSKFLKFLNKQFQFTEKKARMISCLVCWMWGSSLVHTSAQANFYLKITLTRNRLMQSLSKIQFAIAISVRWTWLNSKSRLTIFR